jgi:hypothetical protein
VQIERGFAGEDTERFVVMPLIERVLPADRIAELVHRVRAYVRGEAPAAADHEDTDGERDPAEETA